ncbi:hypothetical protein ACILE2_11060 [Capnocytophaga canimorsus]|uniref:hypothetical protein n=1 Tax=Capnocytophaga canimorsus TaxID=28188 RepID=UPI0037D77318
MKATISLIFSIISFIFSTLIFAITYTNFSIPNWDTASFLVTILAVLVTILISWQIFTFISIDKIIKKALKKSDKETNQKFMIFAFEFYGISAFMLDDDSPIERKLLNLIGLVAYGNSVKDLPRMEREYRVYQGAIKLLEDTFQNNLDEIKENNELKEILLEKIKLFPKIDIFYKLKEILESEIDKEEKRTESKNQEANNNFNIKQKQN